MSIVAKSASNTIKPAETPTPASLIFLPRVIATVVLVGLYYWFRERAITQFNTILLQSAGYAFDGVWLRVISVLLLLGCLLAVWWRMVARDPRFQAPLLITVILALGDAVFGMLENHLCHCGSCEPLAAVSESTHRPSLPSRLRSVLS